VSDKILGYVMARNEWPLLGLSVTHALTIGVDEILVVDHSSDDGTNVGLKLMQKRFPGRIKVLRLEQNDYFQEATTSLISSLVKLENYNWVYVFDADEFLILPSNANLKGILRAQTLETDCIRYSIDQWVSPSDFDDLQLLDYKRIVDKSVPALFPNLPSEILESEIRKGNVNFFDAEFPSKIIVRSKHMHRLGPGSHNLRGYSAKREVEISKKQLVCGHLPLLSKRRLNLKAAQGKDLIENGFPEWHGWQSQMISRLKTEEKLKTFWTHHSSQLSVNLNLRRCALPVTVASQDFSEGIADSVEVMLKLEDSEGRPQRNPEAMILRQPANWSFPIGVIDLIFRERDAILQERKVIIQDLENIIQERDAVTQERDAVTQERDAILLTKTFRWTKAIRDLLSRILRR